MLKLAMEGMSEIPHIEPENLANTERIIKLMKPLFSENTTITEKSDGNYQVDTILNDHKLYEGGQKIKLDLTLIDSILEPLTLTNGGVVEPYVNFIINEFFVNDKKLTIDGLEVYISGNRNENNDPSSSFDCNIFSQDDGIGVDPDSKIILFKSIKTGLSIAGYLHELGHLIREEEDLNEHDDLDSATLFNSKIRQIKENNQDISNGKEFAPAEIELYRKTIYEERRASLKALFLVQKSRDLLPNDPDLSKLKNCYSFLLRSYMKLSMGISPSEVVAITDFDQDWHY